MTAGPSAFRGRGAPLLALAVVLAALLPAARVYHRRCQGLWPAILDDAYISLRYAQHLAGGQGMVYNPGERVEGYTNFLWTASLAPAFVLGQDPFAWTKGLSLLCGLASALATAWLAWRFLARVAGEPASLEGAYALAGRALLAALPAVGLLLTPLAAIGAAEGLETAQFTLLLVLAVALFLGEDGGPGAVAPRRERGAAWPLSALAAALLALSRPDGVVLGPWLLFCAALERRPRAYLFRFAAAFALSLAAYQVLRQAYYGSPLPNTFYAKAMPAGDARLWERGARRLHQFWSQNGGLAWLVLLPALARRRAWPAALCLAGAVALRVLFHLWSGGAYMGEHRFLVPVLPLVFVLAAGGVAALVSGLRLRPAAAWAVTAAATVLVGLAFLAPAHRAYPGQASRLRFYGRSLERGHVALGRAIRDHTAPAAVLALVDAGAAAYFSERETVDLLGLNDAHIARLPGLFGSKIDLAYVLGRRPDLVALVSRVSEPPAVEQLSLPVEQAILASPEFQAAYGYARAWQFWRRYWLHLYYRFDSRRIHPSFLPDPLPPAPDDPAGEGRRRHRPGRGRRSRAPATGPG